MAQHNDTTVGRRIRRARRAADLSQSALGERLGVTRQTINTWENVPGADTSLSIERVTDRRRPRRHLRRARPALRPDGSGVVMRYALITIAAAVVIAFCWTWLLHAKDFDGRP
jgi:DNA-binding XRE family transcriptional regulator